MSASKKHGEQEYNGDLNSPIFVAMSTSQSSDQLWDRVFQHLETYGIQNLTYYHLPPAGAYDVQEPFLIHKGQGNDLSLHKKIIFFDSHRSYIYKCRSLDSRLSFTDFIETAELTDEQTVLFTELHGTGNFHGFIIPCHSANGRSGAFFLKTLHENENYNDSMIRFLSLIAHTAHDTYCVLRRDENKPVKGLTAREKEILTWTAHGKSNSAIADIIGISQHTVNGYLRSIYLKTNTSDRTTAVLRGLGDGLIDL